MNDLPCQCEQHWLAIFQSLGRPANWQRRAPNRFWPPQDGRVRITEAFGVCQLGHAARCGGVHRAHVYNRLPTMASGQQPVLSAHHRSCRRRAGQEHEDHIHLGRHICRRVDAENHQPLRTPERVCSGVAGHNGITVVFRVYTTGIPIVPTPITPRAKDIRNPCVNAPPNRPRWAGGTRSEEMDSPM